MFSCFGFCPAVLPLLRFFALFPLSCAGIYLKEVLPRRSALSLMFFFFFTLFICEMHVLLCACLQVCLWGFPVLVPVCSFPFSPFASFVCFLLGIKGPYLCPVCPPRQHCARLYLLLWCVFFRVLCMHDMTDFSSTTTICAPATLISVANHALMRHY